MALDFAWQDGERVMFIGGMNAEDPQGYTRLVPTMVSARYPERMIEFFPEAVGGNQVNDVLTRLDRDILGNKPDPTWILLNVGLNDVWLGDGGKGNGVPIGQFRDLYDALMLRLSQHSATVVCLTTTVLGEELDNAQNQASMLYNDAIREIAFRYQAQVIDINAAFRDAIQRAQARNPHFRYTIGDDRLNTYGHYLMSMEILRAVNFAI